MSEYTIHAYIDSVEGQMDIDKQTDRQQKSIVDKQTDTPLTHSPHRHKGRIVAEGSDVGQVQQVSIPRRG